jgi:hypothetical protein
MSAALDALVAQVEASRLRTYTAEDGRAYTYEAPGFFTVQALRDAARKGNAGTAEVSAILGERLKSWAGITEADFLGSAVASDTPAAYHPRLWRVWAEKHPAVLIGLMQHIAEADKQEAAKEEAVSGN